MSTLTSIAIHLTLAFGTNVSEIKALIAIYNLLYQ